MAEVIVAERVTKSFELDGGREVVAIRDLDLAVEEGEFVCLVGGSGCGKTTFLNMPASSSRRPGGCCCAASRSAASSRAAA